MAASVAALFACAQPCAKGPAEGAEMDAAEGSAGLRFSQALARYGLTGVTMAYWSDQPNV